MSDETAETWMRALDSHAAAERWRALAELVNDPRHTAEFPEDADRPDSALSRRHFVALLTASAALAAAAGCTRALPDHIVPYARPVPEVTPGVPGYYATSLLRDGLAVGVLALSHEGRPTKIEGNPDHPASLGAAGVFEQAAVLQLYDPARTRALTQGVEPRTWSDFERTFVPTAGEGQGLHILLEPVSSPLIASLITRLRQRLPGAQVHYHAPVDSAAAWEASRLVFGRALDTHYDLSNAEVLLALDADVLGSGPASLRYARDFASRRRLPDRFASMNRLYAVETSLSITGMMADHRLRARPSEVLNVAAAVLAELLATSDEPAGLEALRTPIERLRDASPHRRWAEIVARDLAAHRGAAVVVAGHAQPPEVHALAHALNAALAATGRTVHHTEPIVLDGGKSAHGLDALAHELDAGRVERLIVLDGNPAYTAPADLDLARLIGRAQHSAYLGLYANETAQACQWLLPLSHQLESWGDARAFEGTISLVQPLISPLYDSRTIAEVLAPLAGAAMADARSLLREHWQTLLGSADFDARWERALQRGLFENSALPRIEVHATWTALASRLAALDRTEHAGQLELALRPDARVHDGRLANIAWLQELPDPVTKLTWGNAALLSPATAARLGITSEDVIEVRIGARALRVPALVLPGHADDALTVPLGYGRRGAELLAAGIGVDAYTLRTREALWNIRGVSVRRTGERAALATTQEHWYLDGRDPLRSATLSHFRAHPDFARDLRARASLYLHSPGARSQWGMTIDLSVCTGCSACVLACQAENNIPVVGPQGVRRSREMHWLRIDRYFSGNARDPRVLVQPMLCQHCEQAPCEYVCPVNATVHSPDGLNEQVYNRCIGTRFCSNNCPYKVRRFNFFDYNAIRHPVQRMVFNPEVTVRARGVMEKCTFCVQRIRAAEARAHVEGREMRTGEVITACQQTCPTGAIVFGLLNRPDSEVTRLQRDPRAYSALGELNTRPRVHYLAKISNPNPALEPA